MLRTVLFAVSFFVSSACFAGSITEKEVARKVDILANVAFGVRVENVKAKNAEEMIIKLAMARNGDSKKDVRKNFHRNLKKEEISFSDMVGWGTMKLDAASALWNSQETHKNNKTGEEKDNSRGLVVGDQILNELDKAGLSFGFTDGSSGYCGVSFMGLLIVDKDSETVYEIALSDSDSC